MLLGIRTAPKEDIGCSTAELVYGSPLTVPGDFVTNSNYDIDHRSHLRWLWERIGTLAPIPTSQHGVHPAALPKSLQDSGFVFIRRDAHRTPIQRPYEGPFQVIKAGPKTFRVNIGGKTETVSVDRLKPAHLDFSCPFEVAQPRPRGRPPGSCHRQPSISDESLPSNNTPLLQRTRSGRVTKPPQRYIPVLGGVV